MDQWIDFYLPYFADRTEAEVFVSSYERLDIEDERHPAKVMMHQSQRLVSLADELPRIRPGKESLQLLFLLICAEHIAKLHDNFEEEGRSRAFVRQFFANHLNDAEKEELRLSFSRHDRTPLQLEEVIDFLYDVRCDVVHEGQYWGFHFHDGNTPILNTDPDVIVNLRLDDLRSFVVRGCIQAVVTYPGRSNNAPQPTQ